MLANGKPKRVTFDPMSDGGSTFTTSDENLQLALENNSRFNKLYRLEYTYDPDKVEADEEVSEGASASDEDENPKATEVKVGSLNDIKEYLATTFEIQRSKLKTREAMASAAKEHNVVFIGYEL